MFQPYHIFIRYNRGQGVTIYGWNAEVDYILLMS